MQHLLGISRALVGDRRSVTSLEYALIASVMVAAMAVAVPTIGVRLATILNNLSASF